MAVKQFSFSKKCNAFGFLFVAVVLLNVLQFPLLVASQEFANVLTDIPDTLKSLKDHLTSLNKSGLKLSFNSTVPASPLSYPLGHAGGKEKVEFNVLAVEGCIFKFDLNLNKNCKQTITYNTTAKTLVIGATTLANIVGNATETVKFQFSAISNNVAILESINQQKNKTQIPECVWNFDVNPNNTATPFLTNFEISNVQVKKNDPNSTIDCNPTLELPKFMFALVDNAAQSTNTTAEPSEESNSKIWIILICVVVVILALVGAGIAFFLFASPSEEPVLSEPVPGATQGALNVASEPAPGATQGAQNPQPSNVSAPPV